MRKRSAFKYFKSGPQMIRLAVMLSVRFPLSLRHVENLLHGRCIGVSHQTIRQWRYRSGPIFAAEIRKRQIVIRVRMLMVDLVLDFSTGPPLPAGFARGPLIPPGSDRLPPTAAGRPATVDHQS